LQQKRSDFGQKVSGNILSGAEIGLVEKHYILLDTCVWPGVVCDRARKRLLRPA